MLVDRGVRGQQRPEHPLAGDRGTTLAELTVAMAVFGIFASLLAATAVQTTRLTRDSLLRERSAQAASLVMAQVSRDLRTAVRLESTTGPRAAFAEATASEVVFFSSVQPEVLRERLHPTATGWERETVRPDAGSTYPNLLYTSTDPAMTTRRPLAPTELAVTCSFSYLVRGSSTPQASVAGAQLADVVAVSVRVSVDGDGPGALSPVVLESTVRPYDV